MLQNPLQLRLEKLPSWKQITFMACLCERMYPNYGLFCQTVNSDSWQHYRHTLDAVWTLLTVKDAKIDFEEKLETLAEMIPNAQEHDFYGVYPAIDACIALSELLHGLLDKEFLLETVLKISAISIDTVAALEYSESNIEITNENQKQNEHICAEWDLQWEIFRLLKDPQERDVELILDLRDELKSEGVSNLGMIFNQG